MAIFWNLSLAIIQSNPLNKYIRHEFTVMQRLVRHGFKPCIDEGLANLILLLTDSPGKVLDFMFSFLCSLSERETVFNWLFDNGFFYRLLNRTANEPEIGCYVFKLLNALPFVPDQINPILELIMMTLQNGNFQTKISCMKYIHTVIVEKPECISELLGAGILVKIAEILEVKDPSYVTECLDILLKMFPLIEAANIDVASIPGSIELYDVLLELMDESTDFLQNKLENLISYFPEN
ncbi:hypothetical protein GPJ56_004202 [Histomonas meleagridis]|uniref:uncharacterized protein n=1 Tax=Histomonas meleagridis TaxID=135588 RepID=UPI00355A9EA8|nr:hypothetical protein GPJ56_004202 [Histomonas meleagridis]KAH0802249.1 hypothetical protein GO595_004862 [Histomonas meleagridis]